MIEIVIGIEIVIELVIGIEIVIETMTDEVTPAAWLG